MKKILSTLAVAALALTAAAQVPTTFNYQGKTTQVDAEGKIAAITFAIVDDNGQGKDVYTQEMTNVQTVDNTFNVVIGTAEGWDDINWSVGGLVLVTRIGGADVAVCPLQAVPYAINWTGEKALWDTLTNEEDGILTSIAKEAGKTQTDLETLTDALLNQEDGMLTAIQTQAGETQELVEMLFSEEDGPIANLNQGFTGLSNKVDGMEQDITSLQGAVELLYSEEDGPINRIEEGFLSLYNNVMDTQDDVDILKADVAAHDHAFTELEADINAAMQTIREDYATNVDLMSVAENANNAGTYAVTALEMLNDQVVPDVDALKAGLAVLEEDVNGEEGLVKANRVNATDIAELKEAVAGLDQFTDELNRDYASAMTDLREELVGIEQNFEILFSEDDGPVAAVTTGLTQLSNKVDGFEQDITKLQQDLGVVEDDVRDLVAANRERAVETAELRVDVNSIGENANKAGEIAVWAAEQINDEINPAIANVSSDLQGLQEKMRGIVTIDQYNADMANIDENVEKFNEIIDVLLEQKDANDEAIANVTSDVQGLMEKMRGVATIDALNQVEATLMNVAENANMAAQTAQAAYDKADGLQEAIDYVTSDVQGIQEVLRGKADVQDYTSMKEAIDELRRQIAGNAAAIAGLTALINR